MQERKVLITYEAIYDIVDAEEHIRSRFGDERAKRYRGEIKTELKNLAIEASIYGATGFEYGKYTIYKKPFPPAIIFWIVKEDEVHVLRVPREEYDWRKFFDEHSEYIYTYPETDFI